MKMALEPYRYEADVPYGYWVFWVEPAFRKLVANWRAARARAKARAERELDILPWRFLRLG
jgi:hypothetical protein